MKKLKHWMLERKRNKEIRASLPEAIDLWVVVMQAGLDFQVALGHYLEKAPHHALWDELSRLQNEIRTGASRADALRSLARRTTEPNLQETARTIVQGIELGSSLGAILRTQAQALRKRRAFDAERRAAVAPLKLLFPLMIFIFPTLFVIFFAPLAIQYAGQGNLLR
jgi:tight adherence protein C